jgi:hypothetical protein
MRHAGPVCHEGFEFGGNSWPDGPGVDHSCPAQLTAGTLCATSAPQPMTVRHDDGRADRPRTRVHVAPPPASATLRCRRPERVAPVEGVCCPSRWAKLDDGVPGVAGLLLLALGFAGDLGELGFCWSGAVGSRAWWSSLVVIGRCRAASDGPGTARDRRPRAYATLGRAATETTQSTVAFSYEPVGHPSCSGSLRPVSLYLPDTSSACCWMRSRRRARAALNLLSEPGPKRSPPVPPASMKSVKP